MDAPTAPYVLLIESDGTDNDDWITDHSGDPDDITFTNYTEGTECIVMYPLQVRIKAHTGTKVNDLGAGISYDEKYGKRGYVFTIAGKVTSLASCNYLDKFAMDDRHTTGTDFSRMYLVFKRTTSSYKTFTDQNNASKEYLACNLLSVEALWVDSDPNQWAYQIQGRSVWR